MFPGELAGGEIGAGVRVHGQALPGVQELDEQHRVVAVAGDVLVAEPGDRVGGEGIAQQRAVGQGGEPEGVLAEERRGRSHPVLGHARIGADRGLPPEPRDAVAAEVEAVRRLVRAQGDDRQRHARTLPARPAPVPPALSLRISRLPLVFRIQAHPIPFCPEFRLSCDTPRWGAPRRGVSQHGLNCERRRRRRGERRQGGGGGGGRQQVTGGREERAVGRRWPYSFAESAGQARRPASSAVTRRANDASADRARRKPPARSMSTKPCRALRIMRVASTASSPSMP